MEDKLFDGQYRDEKILLRTRPHWAFFFFEKFPQFLSVLVIAGIIATIGFLSKADFLWVFLVIAVSVLAGFFLYFWWLYTNSRYTITSRRCIYFVRKSLFKRSYNEIHLVDLRTAVPKKS